jgi:predicted  nucleic acid-binding Zn-ribbon protein
MTRPSPTLHARHLDHQHHHHRHDQTQSYAVFPPHAPTHNHSSPIHENCFAVGQRTSDYIEPRVGLEDPNNGLIDASLHIETLECELDKADCEIKLLSHENAVLSERSNRGHEEGRMETTQALVGHLQHLHKSIQDLHGTLRVLMEEAYGVRDDEPELSESRYYFEGGWEDMAKLWRGGLAPIRRKDWSYTAQDGHEVQGPETRPVQHASEPEPGNGNEGADPCDMAYRFERSNTPSPEERRPPRGDRVALRQIDTDMAILHLQDRSEKTETLIEYLTHRRSFQEQWSNRVANISGNYEECISVLLGDIYKTQDEGDDDKEEDEELYCTCGKCMLEEKDATLRSGMGRDEDEKLVYDYGGYTTWDQADEPAQDKDVVENQANCDKDEVIRELIWQVERIEAQFHALTEAAQRENLPPSTDPRTSTNGDDSTVAKDAKLIPSRTITVSVFDEEEKEDEDVNLRGGSGEEESEVDHSRDHVNTSFRTSIPASPHLLCQRATSRVGNSTIDYIVVYLPPGFIIPDSTKPELVFHSAATIYYFPKRATEEIVRREAWKQKACGDGDWQCVRLHKIQSKQVFKNAIANMWETMGLSWNILTRGEWSFDENEDEGEMYMVNNNNLFLTNRTPEVASSHSRGGACNEYDSPIHEPIQTSSLLNEDSLDEFKDLHEILMDEARMGIIRDSPEQRAHAWMTVATTQQCGSFYLERELEEFKEMSNSLIQDLRWNMDVQAELEERLEAAEADKRAMAEDFQDLETCMAYLLETSAVHNPRPSNQEKGTAMRGSNEDSQSTTSSKTPNERIQPEASRPWATATINSFNFYRNGLQ